MQRCEGVGKRPDRSGGKHHQANCEARPGGCLATVASSDRVYGELHLSRGPRVSYPHPLQVLPLGDNRKQTDVYHLLLTPQG